MQTTFVSSKVAASPLRKQGSHVARVASRSEVPVPSVSVRSDVAAAEGLERAFVDTSAEPAASTSGSSFAWFTESSAVLWYLQQLERRPLATKQMTSLSGFALGDIAAQALTEPHYVLSRTLILAIYGWLIDAPCGNAFYQWLDAKIEPDQPKTAKAVAKKIAIDQLIYAPVFTCILYSFLQLAHGDAGSIPEVLQDKVAPTLLANYAVWPAAHALNFYFVPTEQRILYNNFVAICWTTWLSCLAH